MLSQMNPSLSTFLFSLSRPSQNLTTSYELIYLCQPPPSHPAALTLERFAARALPVLFVVSLFFLLLTFVLIFRRNRDKLFGVMTLCMVASLFLFYAVLTVPNLLGPGHVRQHPLLCQIEGLAIQFFYVSALCWLNCMCLLIWKNFRRIRRLPEADSAGNGPGKRRRKCVLLRDPRFFRYAAWAWGAPALLTAATALVQNLPEESTGWLPRPQLGESRCFLGGSGMFFYLHLVTAPCLVFNLLGFACTSWNLCCGVWAGSTHGDPVLRSQQRYRMLTVAKMFFAMGISWVAEVVSWGLVAAFGRRPWVVGASLVFDLLNAVQGVILFLVLFFDSATVSKVRTSLRKGLTSASASEKGKKGQGDEVEGLEVRPVYRARSGSDASGTDNVLTVGRERSRSRSSLCWPGRRKTYKYTLTSCGREDRNASAGDEEGRDDGEP